MNIVASHAHTFLLCFIPDSTEDCYHTYDHGHSYTGPEAVTESGKTCLAWDSSATQHVFKSKKYPELVGAENFCRNPGQLLNQPWCFTDSSGTWEYCDVKSCTDKEGKRLMALVCKDVQLYTVDGLQEVGLDLT